MFSTGPFGKGCCTYTVVDDVVTENDCCKDHPQKEVVFNELTGECTLKVELEPCPCEGCCEFNCCDELDFFMHKAFYDYYNEHFTTFLEFYEAWYAEFYAWWTSPVVEAEPWKRKNWEIFSSH